MATKATYYAEIDPYELACRLVEAFMEVERPEGKTPKEALEQLDQENRDMFMRAARAAFEYFQQTVTEMKREQ